MLRDTGLNRGLSMTEARDEEGVVCPYCVSSDNCPHLLLMVDLTFHASSGGALFEAFRARWSLNFEEEGYDEDFDERGRFMELLDEVDSAADWDTDYEQEGGPGMSSTYRLFYCSTPERVQSAVEAFARAHRPAVDETEAVKLSRRRSSPTPEPELTMAKNKTSEQTQRVPLWTKPTVPVPADAVFLCSVEVYAELDTTSLTFHLHRADGTDTLWIKTDFRSPRVVGSMPATDTLEAAGMRMIEGAMHSRWHFGNPAGGFTVGLLTQQQVLAAFAQVQEEIARTKELAAQTADRPIVALARELRLDPTPSGTGPASWEARCPGGHHYLRIQAETGEFGCGYCKQKGGIEELRAFASRFPTTG